MQALRIVFVVMAIAILALIGWRGRQPLVPIRQATGAVPRLPALQPRSKFPTERQSIEAELAATSDYSAFFADLKRDLPGDYERILNGFAAQAAAAKGRVESSDFYLAETLRSLRQSRGILAAQAEASPLSRVFDVQTQILAKLAATAPTLCVDFLYGGASEPFVSFSKGNRDLIAAMAEAALGAIVDGQAHHIQRQAPSVDDFNLLEQELVTRGLDKVEIGALLDGTMPDPPLPAERMCAAGRAYLDALQHLPDDTRLKMYTLAVELMARS